MKSSSRAVFAALVLIGLTGISRAEAQGKGGKSWKVETVPTSSGRPVRGFKKAEVLASFAPTLVLAPEAQIAVALTSRGLALFDFANERSLVVPKDAQMKDIYRFAMAPDGKVLAVQGDRGLVLVDVASGKLLQRVEDRQALGFAFSPDGKQLAVAFADREVVVYREGRSTFHAPLPSDGRLLAFSPNGRHLAVLCQTDGLIFRTDRKSEPLPLSANGPRAQHAPPQQHDFSSATTIAFSPDGKMFVTASVQSHEWTGRKDSIVGSSALEVWETATGRQRFHMTGANASAAAFPDCGRLCMAGYGIMRIIPNPMEKQPPPPGELRYSDSPAVVRTMELMPTKNPDSRFAMAMWGLGTPRVTASDVVLPFAPTLYRTSAGRLLAIGIEEKAVTLMDITEQVRKRKK